MAKLNDNTPVFCTAEIPEDLLNDFFRAAYSAPEFTNEGVDDVGMYSQHVRLLIVTTLNTVSRRPH